MALREENATKSYVKNYLGTGTWVPGPIWPAGPSTCALSPLPRMGKKNKSLPTIVFDETKRKDYITGFHKRKNERRQHVRSKPARSELLVC